MQCKTGAEHLRSLKDGRKVYIDGKLVDDVTTHAAYRKATASAALLYDYQARPENIELMTFVPEGGAARESLLANAAQLRRTRSAAQSTAGMGTGELRISGPVT